MCWSFVSQLFVLNLSRFEVRGFVERVIFRGEIVGVFLNEMALFNGGFMNTCEDNMRR